jgi:8-oxo-dGTP diphosphatase
MQKASSILFENSDGKILLFLRDNKPTIPYPNKWDMLGGGVEENETFEEAITREMKEEIELDLKDFEIFRIYNRPENIETVFYKKLDLDIDKVNLHEGQIIQYFSIDKLLSMDLAFHSNQVIKDFSER